MRRVCVEAVLSVVAIAGCGTQADPRMMVSDELRTACAAWGRTDDEIIGALQAAEKDRLDGWNYYDEFAVGMQTCSDRAAVWGDQVECGQCFAAVINQVYGL